MKKLECILRPETLDSVKNALEEIGITGMTITETKGLGGQSGYTEIYRGTEYHVEFIPKIKLELYLQEDDVEAAIETITTFARTGAIGDGKIMISPIDEIVNIRTGKRGIYAVTADQTHE